LRGGYNDYGLTEDKATVGTDPSADQGPRRMWGFSFEAPFLFPGIRIGPNALNP